MPAQIKALKKAIWCQVGEAGFMAAERAVLDEVLPFLARIASGAN